MLMPVWHQQSRVGGHRSRVRRGGLFLLVLLVPSAVIAQESLQVPLQFDFLNPGARSLALGSAFTAVADDATAAFTNPAGLVMLGRMEVSAEGRLRLITTPFLSRGRLSGQPTNRGDDTVAGALYEESQAWTASPSFLSFVYPRGRWALAVYRHEFVKLRDDFATRGTFQETHAADTQLQTRSLPLVAERDVNISNYGVSGALRVNDRLSVGGGVSLYHLSLVSSFRRYDTAGDDLFGAPNYARPLAAITHSGDDVDMAFIAGVQYSPHPRVRVGAVYRDGPAFDVVLEEDVTSLRRTGVMQAPNAFTAGVTLRPSDVITVAFDYAVVEYSALVDDYVTMQAFRRPQSFVLEDAHELHGGIEYVLVNAPGMPALRAGVWWDPDHAVRYVPSAANDAFDIRYRATLPGGRDLLHYTAGVGVAVNSTIEVNVAADFTSLRRTFSSSLIYRFR